MTWISHICVLWRLTFVAITMIDSMRAQGRSTVVTKDISWLWRTAYNCAVQGCSEWDSTEDEVADLFDIARIVSTFLTYSQHYTLLCCKSFSPIILMPPWRISTLSHLFILSTHILHQWPERVRMCNDELIFVLFTSRSIRNAASDSYYRSYFGTFSLASLVHMGTACEHRKERFKL